jgi:hypothetical protein
VRDGWVVVTTIAQCEFAAWCLRLIVLRQSMNMRRRFQLVLIKPSHYDDDGYVIRWLRTMIPSNSLVWGSGLLRRAAGARRGRRY